MTALLSRQRRSTYKHTITARPTSTLLLTQLHRSTGNWRKRNQARPLNPATMQWRQQIRSLQKQRKGPGQPLEWDHRAPANNDNVHLWEYSCLESTVLPFLPQTSLNLHPPQICTDLFTSHFANLLLISHEVSSTPTNQSLTTRPDHRSRGFGTLGRPALLRLWYSTVK